MEISEINRDEVCTELTTNSSAKEVLDEVCDAWLDLLQADGRVTHDRGAEAFTRYLSAAREACGLPAEAEKKPMSSEELMELALRFHPC